MITRQDHPRHLTDRDPTGSLKSLCRLIDKHGTELLTFEQAISGTHERTGDDPRLTKELGIDAYL